MGKGVNVWIQRVPCSGTEGISCRPKTDEFKYPIGPVIAVLEIKKNLLRNEMLVHISI